MSYHIISSRHYHRLSENIHRISPLLLLSERLTVHHLRYHDHDVVAFFRYRGPDSAP